MYYDNIPEKIRELSRWVCWKKEERDGRVTKIPVNPSTGGQAMSNNPSTWGSFQQVIEAANKGFILAKGGCSVPIDGIGFIFNGDGILGVDLDHSRNPKTGELESWAREIIIELDSYTEISQSGCGVHILCYGKLPAGKRRRGNVEMYETGRFFVMTGNIMDDVHNEIEERTEQLAAVHSKFIQGAYQSSQSTDNHTHCSGSEKSILTVEEIIEKASSAKNGDKFKMLMAGDTSAYNGDDSAADLALCNELAFWTNCDRNQMDQVFRLSGLYRPKWDEARGIEKTYGSMTIDKAISGCSSTYSAGRGTAAQDFRQYQEKGQNGKVFSLDDIGNGERFVDQWGNEVRYCKSWGGWLIWDDNRWVSDEKGFVNELARRTAKSIIHEALETKDDSRREGLLKHAARSCSNNSLKAMIEQARSMNPIPITPSELDQDDYLFNTRNCTIDLRTGKPYPHDRCDLITRISPVEFDEKAQAPVWTEFLNKIFEGNIRLIKFIQRAVGYSMTGDTSEQCLFLLYGSGQNGKSTLLETISNCLGDYATAAAMQTFLDRTNISNTNDLAGLKGSRFVTAIETNEGARFNEALIKQLTGSDRIKARFLHREYFEFMPTFKIWLAVNHRPVIKGTDMGIWRRIRLIPFNYQIQEGEKDRTLPQKLKKELPGIFNWILEGLETWKIVGLNPPPEVYAATEAYRNDMDNIGDFLAQYTVMQPGFRVRSDILYRLYLDYCRSSNLYPISSKRFTNTIRERGFTEEPAPARRVYWVGMGLASQVEEDNNELPYWA